MPTAKNQIIWNQKSARLISQRDAFQAAVRIKFLFNFKRKIQFENNFETIL